MDRWNDSYIVLLNVIIVVVAYNSRGLESQLHVTLKYILWQYKCLKQRSDITSSEHLKN